ncbi:MAG: cupin domain-containing protein [Gammaproteobacteria bacterium]|nr:cupin domain-containing protein [Gammaproteobacteria bacterium]
MKTIPLSPEDMKSLTARFSELQAIPAQENQRISIEARDLIFARRLLPVIAPKGIEGPFANIAPIMDADFTMTIAICPPGQGPGLHAHHRTVETFTCLKGRFKIQWGDSGEHETVIEEFDTISVPPGVCRAFSNVGNDEGYLQVIITGGINDMNDVAFPKIVAKQLEDIDHRAVEEFEKIGLKFDAGEE